MRKWILSMTFIAFAGCGSGEQQAENAQSQAAAAISRNEVCPAGIPGLATRVEPTQNGGALVLTANPNRVADLRARMNRFAEIHQRQVGQARGPGQDESALVGTERFADSTAAIHRSAVRVIDVPNGVRLEARVRNDADLASLRVELRDDAQDLSEGRCPLSLQIES